MMHSLALAFVLLLAPAAFAAGAGPVPVAYEHGRLSVRLQQADVTEVLREIARQARLEIRGRPQHVQRLDVDLRRVSLHKGLARILAGQSFFIFYAGERPVRVVLLGNGGINEVLAGPPADTPDTPGEVRLDEASIETEITTEADAPEETVDAVAAAEASQRRVPIDGALARAVGADSVSFSDITAVAIRDPSPDVRAAALRVGLDILESEPDLSQSFLQVLEQRDDDALADWLTQVAGEHALELVRRTARESRIEALRLRARGVQRQLEANAHAGGS